MSFAGIRIDLQRFDLAVLYRFHPSANSGTGSDEPPIR